MGAGVRRELGFARIETDKVVRYHVCCDCNSQFYWFSYHWIIFVMLLDLDGSYVFPFYMSCALSCM